MMIYASITYGEGGYLPDTPDHNITEQTWRCECGTTGAGPAPAACPDCGAAADQEASA